MIILIALCSILFLCGIIGLVDNFNINIKLKNNIKILDDKDKPKEWWWDTHIDLI